MCDVSDCVIGSPKLHVQGNHQCVDFLNYILIFRTQMLCDFLLSNKIKSVLHFFFLVGGGGGGMYLQLKQLD